MCIDHVTSLTDSIMLFPRRIPSDYRHHSSSVRHRRGHLEERCQVALHCHHQKQTIGSRERADWKPFLRGPDEGRIDNENCPNHDSFLLPKEFLNEVVKKSGIVEWVVAELKSAENSKLVTSVVNKKSRKLVLEIPKLEGIDYVWNGSVWWQLPAI